MIVIACILAVYLIIALLPRHQSREDNPFVVEGKPLLIAHGGGNREFPDNTLEACYNAYGVDSQVMLEMDVSITKDGVVIMSHGHHFGLPHQCERSHCRHGTTPIY